ncbi:MAG: glycosyltransferase [archaeon]
MNFILGLIYVSVYIGLVATTFYILGYRSDIKKEKPLFTDEELPTISVIIPIFNEEKSIERTLKSLLASKYPKGKLDAIVIDDGSRDNSLEIAKRFEGNHDGIEVKVYYQENKGKGAALNTGIKKANGEMILSMDADTIIGTESIKEMMRYFKNPKVMSVTPSMLIYKPKGLFQRVQQAEYLFGLFIRKAFSSTNSIYVTPGAFSAYRKSFFEKHGYYDEHNITEDLELAFRIQYNGYYIDYCPEATAYTIAPNKFKSLLIQRRRWYTGLMKNTWRYKGLISPKYGDVGMFVIPISWISILFAVVVLNYLIFDTLIKIKDQLIFLNQINYDFLNLYTLNSYFIESFLFNLLSNPITYFFMFFVIILTIYMKYATKKTGGVERLAGTIALYFIFFALLFGFWWTISIFYVAFNRKVKWR